VSQNWSNVGYVYAETVTAADEWLPIGPVAVGVTTPIFGGQQRRWARKTGGDPIREHLSGHSRSSRRYGPQLQKLARHRWS